MIYPNKNAFSLTITVSYDTSDKNNVGWAYWATYDVDGSAEGSGSLAATDEDAAVAEAQALYPAANVVVVA